jgi:DNA-binding transcriptional ArsR family regulator
VLAGLRDADLTLDGLVERCGSGDPTTIAHLLSPLRLARLVDSTREGEVRRYALTDEGRSVLAAADKLRGDDGAARG